MSTILLRPHLNNGGFFLNGILITHLSEILSKNWNILKHENAFENVVCKMAAILSKPQCIHRDIEECVERRHRFPNPDVWFFGASRLRHLLTRFMSLYTGKILNLHDLVSDAKWHSFPLGVKPIQLVSIEPISWNILNIELPWRQFCTHWWHFRLSLTTKLVLGKLFVCLFSSIGYLFSLQKRFLWFI